MKRRPTTKSETIVRWIKYLRQNPDGQITNKDLARVLFLILEQIARNDEAAGRASAAASTALYVANKH